MHIATVIAEETATLEQFRAEYRNGTTPAPVLVAQAARVQYLHRLRDSGGPLTDWALVLKSVGIRE